MSPKNIAAGISVEDKEIILNSGRKIRRSKIEVIQDDAEVSTTEPKRKSVPRTWPELNDVVTATNPWTGEKHTVTMIANKKRKSGLEFMAESGQSFHSPSPLCLYLFGKRVSNGWDCISW